MKILLDEISRQQNQNVEVHRSLYRELLFLSLLSCGAENMDVDALDREYKKAYKEVVREYFERLYPDDKSPTIKVVFCRPAFETPTP
ncbi:DENN domain-containing protein 4C-like [Hydractinia symbiolongicarpus]|uniref:DENN domain-containing protein 4C-like n=1 Tax=Hydractinia symbiolongicarpus TaxID=13093 RepID=UPI00254B327E|nr:DENN domain-containing protein 4C-like [Hydractinia symbiolongicarpus]